MQRLLARADALIVRERVRNYALIVAAMGSIALLLNAVLGGFPEALSGEVVLPDFFAHWTGGRLVLLGRVSELYDPTAQTALQVATVPSTRGLAWFVSPPTSALLFVPVGAGSLERQADPSLFRLPARHPAYGTNHRAGLAGHLAYQVGGDPSQAAGLPARGTAPTAVEAS
jgi:hypothetical protein